MTVGSSARPGWHAAVRAPDVTVLIRDAAGSATRKAVGGRREDGESDSYMRMRGLVSVQRVTPSGLEVLRRGDAIENRGFGSVIVDVGTGDGLLAYNLAKQRPSDLVIGLDPLAKSMRGMAVRASKKPSRGGVSNVIFVQASIEDIPGSELRGVADEVSVILPWGRLLEGILYDDVSVRDGLVALGHPGTRYTVVLNCEIWVERTPQEYEDLPEPTPEYVESVIAPRFSAVGLELDEVSYMSRQEIDGIRSSWARRLAHGKAEPRFLLVRGRLIGDVLDAPS